MPTREVQITFDCADPAALAAFWAEVLGYRVQPPPEGFGSWDEALQAWGLQSLGGARAYRVEPDGRMETGFITMHDLEGNEFCLD